MIDGHDYLLRYIMTDKDLTILIGAAKEGDYSIYDHSKIVGSKFFSKARPQTYPGNLETILMLEDVTSFISCIQTNFIVKTNSMTLDMIQTVNTPFTGSDGASLVPKTTYFIVFDQNTQFYSYNSVTMLPIGPAVSIAGQITGGSMFIPDKKYFLYIGREEYMVYIGEQSLVPIPCHASCATCDYMLMKEEACLTCPVGVPDGSGKCTCPVGSQHFMENGKCVKCQSPCKTCTTSSTTCLTCDTNFEL